MLWFNKKYYEPGPQWSWLPPEHRPDGTIPLHTDWPWPFSKIPRTYTSFIFLKWKFIESSPYFEDFEISKLEDFFIWNEKKVPRSWQEQKIMVTFADPFGKTYQEIYQCRRIGNYLYRAGPRISEGWEDRVIKYCYIDYLNIPFLGSLFTTAIKKLP